MTMMMICLTVNRY